MATQRMATLARVEVESRAAWRRWLNDNHAQAESVFVVTFRKTGRFAAKHVSYDALVEEALCFGWVDSLPRKLDDDRTMLLMSPRRPKSVWSKLNRQRVEQLTAQGLMAPAGLKAVEVAKANGQWSVLDVSYDEALPADLSAAFEANSKAQAFFGAFPPSSRRAILQWLHSAKRADTRAARVAEIVRMAARNVKANFPAGRNAGPQPK